MLIQDKLYCINDTHMNNPGYTYFNILPNFVEFWRAFTLQTIIFKTFLIKPSEENLKKDKIESIDNSY